MSAKIQAYFKWLIPAGIIAILVLVVFSQNGKVVSATVSPEVLVKSQPQEVTVSVALKPGLFLAPAIKAILVGPGKDFNIFTGQKTTLGWLSKQGRDSQGNYIYKGAFTINHPVAETVQVQLSNMFGISFMPKQKNPNTQKGYFDPNIPLLRLAVSTRPFTIPPDPGEAGKATLAGIDSDNDGLRDDVEREIFFAYPQSEKLRIAWWNEYRLQQERMLHAEDKDALKSLEPLFEVAHTCNLMVLEKESQNKDSGREAFLAMLWRNTVLRVSEDNKSITNSSTFGFQSIKDLDEQVKKGCPFDYNSLPD